MAKLEYQNGIAGIKNTKNQYIEVTPAYCDLFRYETPSIVRGLSEYQIADHALNSPYYPGECMAEDFIQQDEYVMCGNSCFIFTLEMIHEQLVASICHKYPYFENNKLAGTVFQMMLLPDITPQVTSSYLNNPNVLISKHTEKYVDVFSLAPARKYNFTQRELECLNYLVKGASAYDAALKLGLSKRTVEFYIRNIKEKIGINKMTEVVAKVISEGIVN